MLRTLRTALAALIALLPAAAAGQGWPAKPLRLVVGFTPGGGVDINARLLAPKLSEYLGQQVIVENKPGAGTNIANEFVAKSTADGYTLLVNTPAIAINRALYRRLGYDVLRDFAPVSIFSTSPNILVVNSAVAAKSVADLLAVARAAPGKLNYSSAGVGTTQHLSAELLKSLSRTFIVHIPYRGTAPSLTALIAGEVDFSFANIPAIQAHVKTGRLRALANTGARRSDLMPDVPTMKESGIDMDVTVWYGVFAPAATPREIVARLAELIARAARSPDVRQKLVDQGAEPIGGTPEEFARVLRAEVATWERVIKAAGIQAED